MATLTANAIVPGLLDRYLARNGFKSQQTDDPPKNPAARSNLWEPADDMSGPDYGSHGSFDRKAWRKSPQVWASQHHDMLLGSALALTIGMLQVVRTLRRSPNRR
jgi:hypothetical protein